jgi:hypothetical protein
MGDHLMSLEDAEARLIHEAFKAYVAVLTIQAGGRMVEPAVQRLAEMAARLSSRVQRHSAGLCDCPHPPSLGGTH